MRLDIHEVNAAGPLLISSAELESGQAPIGGLREATRYWFAVAADGPLTAYVDDVRLEPLPVATTWVWNSGFCVGAARLEFIDSRNTVAASVVLDVTSDDGKLSRVELDLLLDNLLQWAPEKVSGDSQTLLNLGARGQLSGNVIYERIRSYAPLFCKAVQACQQEPHTNFETRSRPVTIQRVRRLSRRNLADPRVIAYSVSASDEFWDKSAPVVVAEKPERNFDTLPNRSLLTMVRKVLRVVEGLRDYYRQALLQQDETEHERSGRRVRVLYDVASSLRDQLSWFSRVHVKPNQDLSAGLAQMLRIPTYSRALRFGTLTCSRSFDAVDKAQAGLPLNSSWGLYEQWCFECVRLALQEVIGENPRHVPGMYGATTEAYIFQTPRQRVILAAQVTFPSGAEPQEGAERYSLSRERRPDAILIVEDTHGTCWYVLDAKYRQSKYNVLDAMGSAHIYRDALLWNGRRCDGAILLTPGSAFNSEWDIFQESHWSRFGTGVMPDFRPNGNGLESMKEFLTRVTSFEALAANAQLRSAERLAERTHADFVLPGSDKLP